MARTARTNCRERRPFAGIELVKIFEYANDVWAAVVAIEEHGFSLARFSGGIIPTDVEDSGGGIEFAVCFYAFGEDAGVFYAEFRGNLGKS